MHWIAPSEKDTATATLEKASASSIRHGRRENGRCHDAPVNAEAKFFAT